MRGRQTRLPPPSASPPLSCDRYQVLPCDRISKSRRKFHLHRKSSGPRQNRCSKGGGWLLTSISTIDVGVLVARVDFPTPSGDGTRVRGLASLGGLGWPFHFILSGAGERMSSMPPANSSLFGVLGAPTDVASFHPRAVREANSSLVGVFGAPLVAATVGNPLHAVCDTNSSLSGLVGGVKMRMTGRQSCGCCTFE